MSRSSGILTPAPPSPGGASPLNPTGVLVKIPIYRMFFREPKGPQGMWPFPIYFFEPEGDFEPDPESPIHPQGWPGTGPDPWTEIEVPDGCRLELCPVE